MDFEESYSRESVGEFIEQLVINEKKLGLKYLHRLILLILNIDI